mgnify:FL=1
MGGRVPCGLRGEWHRTDFELRWRLRAQPEQMLKYLNFLKGKRRKQAERVGSLFADVMTSDLLEHFLRDRSFFRVAILSHELRRAAKVLARAYKDQTGNAWRLLNAAAYHTHCKGCMQYVLRAALVPPLQHVCIPLPALPAWKLMLKERDLLPEKSDRIASQCRMLYPGLA